MSSLDYNYIADLVVRAQGDDTDAFAELYAATYQKQYSFSYSYLNDAYLAQDALQETYTIALKDLSKLKDPMLLVAWLNQINFRVCFRMHKKQARYNAEIADYENLHSDADPESPPRAADRSSALSSEDDTPEDIIIRIDSRNYIMKQVLSLPFTESQVILLRFFRNMKYDEIASLMEMSRSSVKRYLNSGKAHLAQIFQSKKGDYYV